MDDLPNLLQRDFGLKPQGKAAPMAAPAKNNNSVYDDVFGGPPKFTAQSFQNHKSEGAYDDIFRSFSTPINNSSVPVLDAPVYDNDDIFGGVKGLKSGTGVTYDDVFSAGAGGGRGGIPGAAPIEDLLMGEISGSSAGGLNSRHNRGFEDLATQAGFGNGGGDSANKNSRFVGDSRLNHRIPIASQKAADNSLFSDPLEQLNMQSQPSGESNISSNGTKGFDGFTLTGRAVSSPMNKGRVAKSPLKTSHSNSPTYRRGDTESIESRSLKNNSAINNYFMRDHNKTHGGMARADLKKSSGKAEASSTVSSPRQFRQPLHENSTYVSDLSSRGLSPLKKSEKGMRVVNERLVTVDEIKLWTKPTTLPPPSRLPPPLVIKQGPSSNKKLEGFASGGYQVQISDKSLHLMDGMMEGSSAAAASTIAMKEAMERAESKLKLAKEAREKKREGGDRETKIVKSQEKERQNRRDERKAQEDWEQEEKERVRKAAQEDYGQEDKDKVAKASREARERDEKEKAAKVAREARERDEKEKAAKAAREARERDEKEKAAKAAREARERDEKEKAAKAAREARERDEKEKAAKAAREARERDEKEKTAKATREARERDEKEKAAKAAQEARERDEKEKVAKADQEAQDEKEKAVNAAREVPEKEDKGKPVKGAPEACEREEKIVAAKAASVACEREDHEKDEQEKERRKRERERERDREREHEREREREKDRIAVERATKEARERAEKAAAERAVAEARERAAVEARERAAFERAAAEARERAAAEVKERAAAERAAFERAAAEARERAAAYLKERAAADRSATSVRERVAAEKAVTERAEARLRAERAASERAMAEARERAAERAAAERVTAEARERVERAVAERAAAARERQRRNENDLESLFGVGARADSAPKQRPSMDASGEVFQKATAGTPQSYKRSNLSSSTADDWTSLFSVPSNEFQDIPGESAERRRARLERHQRTRERAAKALAEKNDRDLQAQREQAERHRLAETLDADVKRWVTGKEGNLRALLSTLQYILWPESGWQPVSLTDIITPPAVKKVYRKATLCVHPDKVQQKGATIQQKYIAEKVFDLLKEGWNKFNSEELY